VQACHQQLSLQDSLQQSSSSTCRLRDSPQTTFQQRRLPQKQHTTATQHCRQHCPAQALLQHQLMVPALQLTIWVH
jgi:hypothetical protein